MIEVTPPRSFFPTETPDAVALERTEDNSLPSPEWIAGPADLTPVPRWWVRLAWYAGVAFLSSGLIVAGLRLDLADLRAPLYYDLDSLLILPMVKATVEQGFGGHWHIDRLGAPAGLDLYDFPVIDHLHFFLLWLLSRGVPDLALLYNLYFLLTFPLTAVAAMWVFRTLRLTLPAAAVGGLLYAFLPYHYQRWENHYFLAAYWLVPVSLLPVFAMCAGRLPFFRRQADGSYRRCLVSWSTVGVAALAAATASAGAYYAFFTCAFMVFAGCYAASMLRLWQPLISAAVVAGSIVAFGVVNHLPTLVYQAKYGRNPITDRMPFEADVYGLKIAQLVMPIEDHRVDPLARYKRFYNEPYRPSENENKSSALGLIGSVGFLGLIAIVLLPHLRRWPYGPLAALTAFGVLLATIGGFGAIFNLIVSAQIRSYNRISVFLEVFCLLAVLWTLDRYLAERRRTVRLLHLSYTLLPVAWPILLGARAAGPRWQARVDRLRQRLHGRLVGAAPLVWGGVLLIGLLDQIPAPWFRHEIANTIDEQASRFRADAQFFAAIEQAMPPGSLVFNLPYIPFPEYPSLHHMPVYEPLRGYLHTYTLKWSAGAIKGRETDAWLQEVAFQTAEQMLQRVVYRGFDGLLVDRRGYPTINGVNKAYTMVSELNTVYARLIGKITARLPEILHTDGQQLFLDLRPYRDALRVLSPALFDAKSREEAEWPAVIWLNGFYCPDPTGEDHTFRYGPKDGTAWIINPADHTRRFKLTMTFCPVAQGLLIVRLSGLVTAEINLDRDAPDWDKQKEGVERKYEVEVPPGRSPLRIRCMPPPSFIPNDIRQLAYFLRDFKIEEVK